MVCNVILDLGALLMILYVTTARRKNISLEFADPQETYQFQQPLAASSTLLLLPLQFLLRVSHAQFYLGKFEADQ